jgi:DNA modification methylase
MGGATAQVQFTDPPFNRRTRTFSGRGRVRHRDFVQAAGEMTDGAYIDFLTRFLRQSSQVLADGGISFTFIDWQHLFELLSAGRRLQLKLENLVVWSKAPGMGGLYRSAHELIAVFRHGDAPCINNVVLGANGRNRSNVWHHPSAPNFSAQRKSDLAAHPTPKPVELVADALRDVSGPGSIVIDPFLGSGTTLIAAEKTGRIAYGMELDPRFCDVVVRRWQRYAGKTAVLEGCNTPFDIVEAQRAAEKKADECHNVGQDEVGQ